MGPRRPTYTLLDNSPSRQKTSLGGGKRFLLVEQKVVPLEPKVVLVEQKVVPLEQKVLVEQDVVLVEQNVGLVKQKVVLVAVVAVAVVSGATVKLRLPQQLSPLPLSRDDGVRESERAMRKTLASPCARTDCGNL